MTKNYYQLNKNWGQAISNAERKVEELRVQRAIIEIDRQLSALEHIRGLYPVRVLEPVAE